MCGVPFPCLYIVLYDNYKWGILLRMFVRCSQSSFYLRQNLTNIHKKVS